MIYAVKFIILPILEIGLLCYAGFVIIKSRKALKASAVEKRDAMESLREALAAGFPVAAAGRAVAFELAGFYYAFFKWRRKKTESGFTYHRRSGSLMLLGVFIFLILSETIVLHFVIAGKSPLAAWILTALSLYFVLQLFAHLKAVLLRPIELGEKDLRIRCGIIGDSRIRFERILNITKASNPLPVKEPAALSLTACARMTAPNVRIELAQPETLNGFYGLRKKFTIIYLALDEPEKFAAKINEKSAPGSVPPAVAGG